MSPLGATGSLELAATPPIGLPQCDRQMIHLITIHIHFFFCEQTFNNLFIQVNPFHVPFIKEKVWRPVRHKPKAACAPPYI